MDYKQLLEHSYVIEQQDTISYPPKNRLEYLSDHIFDFTTYDSAISCLFAQKAVEVCDAITNRTTFEYIKSTENYRWFLLMCNMPFFADKLDWGTSIRGAWWTEPSIEDDIVIKSCGLHEGDRQLLELELSLEEWNSFIQAVVEFAQPDTPTKLTPSEDKED